MDTHITKSKLRGGKATPQQYSKDMGRFRKRNGYRKDIGNFTRYGGKWEEEDIGRFSKIWEDMGRYRKI